MVALKDCKRLRVSEPLVINGNISVMKQMYTTQRMRRCCFSTGKRVTIHSNDTDCTGLNI